MKHLKMCVAITLVVALIAGVAIAETARLGAARYSFSPSGVLYKTADYTVTTSEKGKTISVDATSAAANMTLPSVTDATAGGTMTLKVLKSDSSVNVVTVTPASGDTIGGESARKLVNQNGYIVIHSGPGRDWTVDFESPYIVEDHEAGSSDLGTQGYDASIVFEGATANAFETTLAVTDPTADATWEIPAATAGTYYFMSTALATNYVDAANSVTGVSNGIKFEGSTADGFETTLTVADPGADYTATLPAATGTLKMTAGVGSYEPYSTVTVSTTLTTADCGKTYATATDTVIFNLPATAAGCKLTFINSGAAGNNLLTINPDDADQIFGTVTLAASVVAIAGSAGDAVSNTKGTSIRGDSMTLIGDGVDGWYIVSSTGIWADIN